MSLPTLLTQLHLNDRETAVFLALVKLAKPSTIAEIARTAQITRTYVYEIIDLLIKRGLVSEVKNGKIKVYESVDHAGLMAFVSRQKKELDRIEKSLLQTSSEFNALQVGKSQKTKVRFFDGIEGIKTLYGEIKKDFEGQQENFELLTIFSPENLLRVMPEFTFFSFPKAHSRDIVCADNGFDEYRKQIKAFGNNIEFCVWPKGQGVFPTDNIAWKNKIAYLDLVDYPSGIIVENVSMNRTFTMWFNKIWESLKHFN